MNLPFSWCGMVVAGGVCASIRTNTACAATNFCINDTRPTLQRKAEHAEVNCKDNF